MILKRFLISLGSTIPFLFLYQHPSNGFSLSAYLDWTSENNPNISGRSFFNLSNGIETANGFEGMGGLITNAPMDADGEVFNEAVIKTWTKSFIDDDEDGIIDRKIVEFEYGEDPDEPLMGWDGIVYEIDPSDEFISGSINNLDSNNTIADITNAVHKVPEPAVTLGILIFGAVGILNSGKKVK